MQALKIIIPIYIVLFLLYGRKDLKRFLLLTGIVSIPFPTQFSIVHFPHQGWIDGIVINLSDVSFILLFLYLIFKGGCRWTAPAAIVLPTLSFAGAIALSTINSTMQAATLLLVIMIVKSFVLYYFVLLNVMESEEDVRSIITYLSISLGIQAVLGCAGTLFGIDTDFLRSDLYRPEKLAMASGLFRATGTLGYPNALAGYIVPLILLNITLFLRIQVKRSWRVLLIVISMVALVLSASRNGWVSFTAVFIFMLVQGIRRSLISKKLLVLLTILLTITLGLFSSIITDRLTRSDHGASEARIPLMQLALNMASKHPVIGVGGNTFANIADDYITNDLQGMFVTIVHNQYLLVLSECGIIGLLTFLWLIWGGLQDARLCAKNPSSSYCRAVGLGVLFGMASILISMLFDMFKADHSISTLFVLFAVSSYGGRYFQQGFSASPVGLSEKGQPHV